MATRLNELSDWFIFFSRGDRMAHNFTVQQDEMRQVRFEDFNSDAEAMRNFFEAEHGGPPRPCSLGREHGPQFREVAVGAQQLRSTRDVLLARHNSAELVQAILYVRQCVLGPATAP